MTLSFKDNQPFHLCPQPGTTEINIAKCVIGDGGQDEIDYVWELVGTVRSLKDAVEVLKRELKKGFEPKVRYKWRAMGVCEIQIGMFNPYGLIGMVYMSPDGKMQYARRPKRMKVRYLGDIESLTGIFTN
jgi:hypothetical protein